MKLPKFIKSSSTHQERQQNLIKCNRQLQLTDNIFKIQPQKQSNLFRDIINESKINNQQDDSNKTPCTPLYQFKSNKFNESNLNINFSAQTATGRYVKSAQPKRLQRNRLHLAKKPEYYEDKPKFNIPSTPIKPSEIIMNSNGRKLNTNDLDKENLSTPSCQPKSQLETPVSNKKEQETPSSNRFSLSKLTKFVSKSALKVINRKSFGSTSSSPDTSSNSSMQTDDEDENQKQEVFNTKIYSSLEQQQAIEAKINAYQRPNKPSMGNQPSMGLTSMMLKNMKKQSKKSGYTTGITCYPNSFLVSMPIVFNSDNLKEDKQIDQTYDRLQREPIPFITEQRTNKKMNKPIVKSLSSIQSLFESPKNNATNSLSKLNLNSPILPSTNSCRISVYTSKNNSKLEKQLHYESFSEAIF